MIRWNGYALTSPHQYQPAADRSDRYCFALIVVEVSRLVESMEHIVCRYLTSMTRIDWCIGLQGFLGSNSLHVGFEILAAGRSPAMASGEFGGL